MLQHNLSHNIYNVTNLSALVLGTAMLNTFPATTIWKVNGLLLSAQSLSHSKSYRTATITLAVSNLEGKD